LEKGRLENQKEKNKQIVKSKVTSEKNWQKFSSVYQVYPCVKDQKN